MPGILSARLVHWTFSRAHDGSPISGDFVECVGLGAGKTAVLIGDIAGRGKEANAAACELRAFARSLIRRGLPLPDLAQQSDAFFQRFLLTDATPFASLFVAVADPAEGTLSYISAGHETALIARYARHTHLQPTAPLLGLGGLGAAVSFGEATNAIESDTLLVLVTDGITDARRRGRGFDDTFGSRGVIKAAVRAHALGIDPSREVYRSAMSHAASDLEDDASIVCMALAPARTHW